MSKRPGLPTTGSASERRGRRLAAESPGAATSPFPIPAYSRQIGPGAAAGLTSTEWLLTDGAGGFAMGTVAGAPTRRYHAWLIAATTPPVGRISMLASCAEWLVEAGDPARRHDLSTFLFPGSRSPRGEESLVRFEAGATIKWVYELPTSSGIARVTRELLLVRRGDGEASPSTPPSCTVRYTVENAPAGSRLVVRPLVSMRDFHGLLQGRQCPDRFLVVEGAGRVALDVAAKFGPLGPGAGANASPTLNLAIDGAEFSSVPEWWYDFEYPIESSRGQDCREDLFSPGEFSVAVAAGAKREPVTVELRAWVGGSAAIARELGVLYAAQAARAPRRLSSALATHAVADSELMRAISRLAVAADQFVVKRDVGQSTAAGPRETSVSVIAGYPWFSDWGRDTMICLPGLMLATGRFDEARKTLETFARLRRDGLIPNWFDNAGNAEYNTVDGALWFIHAACRYAEAAGEKILDHEVGRACLDIVGAYRAGTVHSIRMDEDGLITAGDAGTQLTWMDAKRDGFIFTPRYGKPVEVNALWYNALRSLADLFQRERPADTHDLSELADRVGASFRAGFWNQRAGCLNDVLVPERGSWRPDGRTRPNQIFAVSLPHSPLTPEQQASVVDCVRRKLLTPVGLRTLSPGDPGYLGRFRGNLFERDRAYHNGTVWPWLLGPFAEATMRIADFSKESQREAYELLRPVLAELDSAHPGCLLGQLPEVYDGDDRPDEPRQPGGCPAQAWSIAEPLRVLALLAR